MYNFSVVCLRLPYINRRMRGITSKPLPCKRKWTVVVSYRRSVCVMSDFLLFLKSNILIFPFSWYELSLLCFMLI